jgi:hypothetical protein
MVPFVLFGVDWERDGAARMPGDDDLGAALIEVGDDIVASKALSPSFARPVNPMRWSRRYSQLA